MGIIVIGSNINDRCLNKTGGGGVGACRTRNPGVVQILGAKTYPLL